MKDRRRELRPNTRLQLLSVSGRLSGLSAADLERTLTLLYVSQPLRWQTFMCGIVPLQFMNTYQWPAWIISSQGLNTLVSMKVSQTNSQRESSSETEMPELKP